MKKKNHLAALLVVVILSMACRFSRPEAGGENTPEPTSVDSTAAPSTLSPTSEPQAQTLQFSIGRNDYTINVDDTPREFIVYVPAGYDPSSRTPVVVMCHGSNQHPNTMYENTSWVRKADEENIIIVFPASWKYPLISEPGVHEKWNTPGTAMDIPPGTELKDDVKFIRAIIDNLKLTFNVDENRIFASGFSNGGGFVITRLLSEMNDVFSAFATGGAGLLNEEATNSVPIQTHESLYNIIGSEDNKISEGQGISVPFPLGEQEILNHPNFGSLLQSTTAYLSLEMSYLVEVQPDFTRFTFDKSLVGSNNEYVFMMIKGLHHVYPSGDDNRTNLDAADLFWDFFLKHPKP